MYTMSLYSADSVLSILPKPKDDLSVGFVGQEIRSSNLLLRIERSKRVKSNNKRGKDEWCRAESQHYLSPLQNCIATRACILAQPHEQTGRPGVSQISPGELELSHERWLDRDGGNGWPGYRPWTRPSVDALAKGHFGWSKGRSVALGRAVSDRYIRISLGEGSCPSLVGLTRPDNCTVPRALPTESFFSALASFPDHGLTVLILLFFHLSDLLSTFRSACTGAPQVYFSRTIARAFRLF